MTSLDTTRYLPSENMQMAYHLSSFDFQHQKSSQSLSNLKAETEWGIRDGRSGILSASQLQEDERLFDRHSTGIDFSKYQEIPVQTSEAFTRINSFEECGVHPVLWRNMQRLQYHTPTPVQKYLISAALQGKDVIAVAQTGSGKTAAYLLPIILRMLNQGPPREPGGRCARPVALVLAPTRELAIQIHEEARKLIFRSGIRAVVVYGGADPRTQGRELDAGADILVATPGRLIDFMGRGRVQLTEVTNLVLDEADRMLDMGFEPQVRQILEGFRLEVHTMMCSATFAPEVQQLAYRYMRSCIFMSLGRVGSATDYVSQEVYYVENRKKVMLLHDILQKIQGLVLIFVQMKKDADALARVLYQIGYSSGCIHGDRMQGERERALQAFRDGTRPILVATDVASRGLDIPNVAAVLNFDPPHGVEDYVHRIGRTGRAGRDGRAITFLGPKDINISRDLYRLFKDTNQPIPEWFEEMHGDRRMQRRDIQGW